MINHEVFLSEEAEAALKRLVIRYGKNPSSIIRAALLKVDQDMQNELEGAELLDYVSETSSDHQSLRAED